MAKSDADEESLEAMKQIYLLPMDALEADSRARTGQFVNFANYDYVGLGDDARVKRAAAAAAIEFGVGAGASRLVGGNRTIHDQLERELAEFLRVEASVSLVSGYLTNASLISHLFMTREDQVFVDALSHNSIVVGAEMSRASVFRFSHNDLNDLEAKLSAHRKHSARALIVVEGLYSMDGDIPDLPRLLELRDRYDAWLLIDEAHSIGVLGASGRGICEHFGIDPGEIDFIVGTLSKAFGASGGFIAARQRTIDWLRFTLPAFVFSVGLSPMVVEAVREGLRILQAEPDRVRRVRENGEFFVAEAQRRGIDVGDAIGAGVISVQFQTHQQCMHVAKALYDRGYYAPPIPMLAVPTNRPRIRFFISCMPEREVLSSALDIIESVLQASSAPDEAWSGATEASRLAEPSLGQASAV